MNPKKEGQSTIGKKVKAMEFKWEIENRGGMVEVLT
jgi:hypothetical protein